MRLILPVSLFAIVIALQFFATAQASFPWEKRGIMSNLKMKLPGLGKSNGGKASLGSPKSIFSSSVFSSHSSGSGRSTPASSAHSSPTSSPGRTSSPRSSSSSASSSPAYSPSQSPHTTPGTSPKTSPGRPEWYERGKHSPEVENYWRTQHLASQGSKHAEAIARNKEDMHRIVQRMSAKGRDTSPERIQNSKMAKIPNTLERSYLQRQQSLQKHEQELHRTNEQIKFHHNAGTLKSPLIKEETQLKDMHDVIRHPINQAKARMHENKPQYRKSIDLKWR